MRSLRKTVGTYRTGVLFFLPFFLFFTVFTIIPVLLSMALSLTDFNLLQSPVFLGLTNFRLLFLEDEVFLIALKNTLTFAVIAGPFSFTAAFLLAWAINQMRIKNLYALAFYVPSITNAVAVGVVWLYIFSPDRYGLVNNLLYNLGLISEPILWSLDKGTILTVIIMIYIWQILA